MKNLKELLIARAIRFVKIFGMQSVTLLILRSLTNGTDGWVLFAGCALGDMLGIFFPRAFDPFLRILFRNELSFKPALHLSRLSVGSACMGVFMLLSLLTPHRMPWDLVDMAPFAIGGALFLSLLSDDDDRERRARKEVSEKISALVARVRAVHGPTAVPNPA